jgi:hypothetical protein
MMKSKQERFSQRLRRIFRRGVRSYGPVLVLNMLIFNFTEGWNPTLIKYGDARFWA